MPADRLIPVGRDGAGRVARGRHDRRGLILGLKRKTIVEFSFLLAVPTMLAASGLDLIKSGHSFTGSQFGLLAVGFITAFAVALLAVKLLINYIKKYDFKPFGVYRIVIGLLFFWLISARKRILP